MANVKKLKRNSGMRGSVIKCSNCSHKTIIPRNQTLIKEEGHIKNFHCPNCKTYQKHVEINNYETYQFKVVNGEIIPIKIFKNDKRREVTIITNPVYFKKWRVFEDSQGVRAHINNSDYNLIENLILNFNTNESFKDVVLERYKEDFKIFNEVVLKFNISHSVYSMFLDKVKELNLDPGKVLYYIMSLSVDSELDFNF